MWLDSSPARAAEKRTFTLRFVSAPGTHKRESAGTSPCEQNILVDSAQTLNFGKFSRVRPELKPIVSVLGYPL